jgi:glycosidase
VRGLGAASLLLAAATASQAGPTVSKVEPPSWWPSSSLNPVRLLLTGRGLGDSRIVAIGPGLTAGPVTASANGRYAFVDLTIAPDAAPGPRRLALEGPAGRTEARFDVVPPLVHEGRFQGFGPGDFIYEVMLDRFANGEPGNDDPPRSRGLHDRSKARYYHGGDLAGLRARLPYLRELGVTVLWLTPIYDNNDRLNERETYDGQAITDYHGYGAVDFYAVEEHFGDLAALRALVDEAHRVGIKVVQDQVVNHTGPYHPWAEDPPTPTWFNGTPQRHLKNSWQIWSLADPYATPETRAETLGGWFIDLLPDLNQGDPEAARYLIQNALWWVGMAGFDGIRQDTLPYVPRSFWRDWSASLKREFPRLTLLGEMWHGDAALVAFFQGGAAREGIDSGIDALFDFPLFYPLRRAFIEGKAVREVAEVLARDALYPDPERLVTFVGLHDVPRFMGEPGASLEGLALALSLVMTTRGIPMLYYGDELGLPGAGDPDNRRDFPGGWRGDRQDAFVRGGLAREQQALVEHVRRLARLRRELPALGRGRLRHLLTEEQRYAFARTLDSGSVLVVFNNAADHVELDVPVASLGLADGTLLADQLGGAGESVVSGGHLRLALPGRSAAVLAPR